MEDSRRSSAHRDQRVSHKPARLGSRLVVYALLVLSLALIVSQGGPTWAQPHQNGLRDSVPTRVVTATCGPSSTSSPTPEQHVTRLLLQQVDAGQEGYRGTIDTYIDSDYPRFASTLEGNLKLKGAGGKSTLLRFDLEDQLPPNAQVVAAELVFYVDHPTGTVARDLGVGIYRVLQQWSEPQASWSYRHAEAKLSWDAAGCESAGVDRVADPDDIITLFHRCVSRGFDVTASVQYLIQHPEENWGWLIKGVSASTASYILGASRHRDQEKRPMLRIDYTLAGGATHTPTPGTPTATLTPGTPMATPTAGTPTATPQGGSILVTVYHDLNESQSPDQGEPGLSGVTVELLDYATRQVVAQRITGPDGTCLFDDLAAGYHRLREQNPADYVSTTDDEIRVSVGSGQTRAYFGDRSTVAPSATPTLVPGDGVITVAVYDDQNGNSELDAGEGLADVGIELRDADDTLLSVRLTDADGTCRWDELQRACYRVREIVPWGYVARGDSSATRCLAGQPADVVFEIKPGSALALPLIVR